MVDSNETAGAPEVVPAAHESAQAESYPTEAIDAGAIAQAGAASDPRPEAFVRVGLMQRLFGGGHRVEDQQTGLMRYDQRPGLLRPFARRSYQRDAALSSIREGFDDLSDLMGDIRDGLAASVEKQGELLEHLKYLPVVAEQNARSAERFEEQSVAQNRLQVETIRAIREQIQGQSNHQEQITRVLGTMGRESRDQKRDLDDFQGRLERMRQSDQAIADNLSNVGAAVRKVSEQGAAQGELAARMQESFDERTRQLEEAIRRQSSRQGLLLAVALALALLAAGAVAVVGFLYLRQSGAI